MASSAGPVSKGRAAVVTVVVAAVSVGGKKLVGVLVCCAGVQLGILVQQRASNV